MDGFYTRQRGGHGLGRVRARLLPEGGPRLHPARRPTPSSSTTATSARSWPRPTRTATTSSRRRTGARSRTCCRRRRPERASASSGRRSSTGRWRAGSRSATTSPTCRCRRSTASAGCAGCARSSQFYADAAAGHAAADLLRRPAVSRRRRRRRGLGRRAPHGDVRLGQAFMSDVAHAFIESPAVPARGDVHQLRRVGRVLRPRARRGACPTTAPTARTSTNDWSITGFRVPAVAISPYARAGRRAGGSAT